MAQETIDIQNEFSFLGQRYRLPSGKVQSVSVNGQTKTPDSQGNVDLGNIVGQQGPKGDTGNCQITGDGSNIVSLIVNDLTTGGAGNILSAEMGKRVAGREATDRQRIDAIVAILKKSVFTDDQTAAFAALDALANGIDSISFNASSHKFTNIGDTFTLSVVTDPAGKTAQISSWTSNNTSVATVNNGVVTAVADGNATITATTSDGKVAVCNIEVATIHITGLSLNKSTLTLNGNDANETLIATTVPAGYESGIEWTSSDPTKATVDNNGKVTAVANTAANTPVIITASIGGQTATCQVTVTGVLQTFHISLGTLSNVTVEDGEGTAIANNQAVLENSSLTVKLVPAASHQITTASVTMNDVAQTLTDNQDGSKSVALTVDGDIAISASAEFHAVNLANQSTLKTGYGVRSTGKLEENASLSAYVIPITYGKRYIIRGWEGVDATMNANRIAILKGNTNNSACLASGDFDNGSVFYTQNELFASGNCLKNFPARDFMSFKAPLASDMVDATQQLYIGINCAWTGSNPYDVTQDIEVYECPLEVGSYIAVNRIWQVQIKGDKTFTMDSSAESSLVKLDKGGTYDFSGYTRSTGSGQQNYANFAILKTGNGGMTWEKLTSADVPGYQSDFFTVDTNGVIAQNVGESGTFTVPSSDALASGVGDLYLFAKMKYGSLLLIDDTNLVIEKR